MDYKAGVRPSSRAGEMRARRSVPPTPGSFFFHHLPRFSTFRRR
jgi:hypothetical protein